MTIRLTVKYPGGADSTHQVQSFTKKIQKVLMKIDEMADVFLNSANFTSHALLTLAPLSSYTLNKSIDQGFKT